MSQYQFQGNLDILKEDISESQTISRNRISARDLLAVCFIVYQMDHNDIIPQFH